MLKIIKEELEQYIIKESFICNSYELHEMIEKFESDKNYLMVIEDKSYDYFRAISWLDNYDYDVYNIKLFNYSSHIISKYYCCNFIFYEIEKSFDSKRFYQIIEHIFSNCYNSKLLSDSFAVSINNYTIGKIIIEYTRLDNLKKNDNAIFYPEKINLDTNEKIQYYYKN
jgi:hypothetical protein